MGTPSFAVPSLQALLASRHAVVAVVTQPDRPAGRGLAVRPPPVKGLALERSIPVLQPAKVRTAEFVDQIRSCTPDLLVVVAFGRILPLPVLEAAPGGGINLHASLLPKYRGAAPIAWAIAGGETVTGVTTMKMAERLDSGDILLQTSTAILDSETTGDLEARLAAIGARLLIDTLDAVEKGTIALLPQKEEQATFAPIIGKQDARIDWSAPASDIALRVRAFNPWPVSFTIARGRGMQVWKARATDAGQEPGAAHSRPGMVVAAGPGGVRVACGGGSMIEIVEAQPEGRKRMTGAMAAAGRYFAAGEILG